MFRQREIIILGFAHNDKILSIFSRFQETGNGKMIV